MSSVRDFVPKSKTKTAFYCCALVLAIVAVYLNSLGGELIFDDLLAIRDNPSLHPDNGLWRAFFAPPDGPVGGRPLVNFSFFLNYSIAGTRVVGYHVANVLVHAATAVLLYLLISHTLAQMTVAERFKSKSRVIAFLTSLLWGLSPLQTICVSYISQRSELMMGFCYTATLYCFSRFLSSSADEKDSISTERFRAAAIFFCGAGMLSKEVMVTAPLLCLLYDRSFFSGSFASAFRRNWRTYLLLVSTWVLLAVLHLTTKGRGVGLEMGVTWYKYLLTESRVVLSYIRLCVCPYPLVFDYGTAAYNATRTELPFVLITGSLVVGCSWCYLQKANVWFLAAAFFIPLATTSSFIPVALQPMAENRLYLPSMAVTAALVFLVFRISSRTSVLVVLTCSLIFAVSTVARNRVFHSGISIWSDTTVKVPTSARAYNNLGISLLEKNRLDDAENAFRRALQLRPNWADVVSNLGNIALAKRDSASAEKLFRQAVADDPSSVVQKDNLAGLLLQQGNVSESKSLYEAAFKLKPTDASALCGLGDIALAEKDLAKALEFYRRAVAVMPHFAIAHNNLGNALVQANEEEQAEHEFRRSIELNPNFQKARSNYATMLARRGQYVDAIAQYKVALQLYEADTEARVNMGLAYQSIGDAAAAEACYKDALKSNPTDTRAKQFLENLRSSRAPRRQP